MNKAEFISKIVDLSPNTVRVWFSRRDKSLHDDEAVREYLIHKLIKRVHRSDKGFSRATPWLDYYKFGSNNKAGKCIICGKRTSQKRNIWNSELGEEKEVFLCCKIF